MDLVQISYVLRITSRRGRRRDIGLSDDFQPAPIPPRQCEGGLTCGSDLDQHSARSPRSNSGHLRDFATSRNTSRMISPFWLQVPLQSIVALGFFIHYYHSKYYKWLWLKEANSCWSKDVFPDPSSNICPPATAQIKKGYFALLAVGVSKRISSWSSRDFAADLTFLPTGFSLGVHQDEVSAIALQGPLQALRHQRRKHTFADRVVDL